MKQTISHSILNTALPRFEAELLLSYVLKVSRAYLYAHPERILTGPEQLNFEAWVRRRQAGEPVAYIVGRKSFWSFDLFVTPDTLIPRPETELLVELALSHLPQERSLKVADLGTGSGAIGIALAIERPRWQVVATDFSEKALSVAKRNAQDLNCSHIDFYQGSWCEALPEGPYAAILSNPPYISPGDPTLESTVYDFEPHSALFSEREGLQDIETIIRQAPHYLEDKGFLFLEHGEGMSEAVVELLERNHYTQISSYSDFAGKLRVVMGRIRNKSV